MPAIAVADFLEDPGAAVQVGEASPLRVEHGGLVDVGHRDGDDLDLELAS
jgi:hypothetical protein